MRLALAILLLTGSTAAAQPSMQPPVAHEDVQYGGALVPFDLIGIAATVGGAYLFVEAISVACDDCTGDQPGNAPLGALLFVGGTITYLVGPPVVHGKMGNKSGAGKSVMMRLFFPFVGGAIGTIIDGDGEKDSGPEAELYGIGVATAAAVLIDWMVVSKVERPTSSYTPTVTRVRDGGMTFGIAGSF
jgi:hypothetical protein